MKYLTHFVTQLQDLDARPSHTRILTPPICKCYTSIYSIVQFPDSSSCLASILECLFTSSNTPLIPSISGSSFISLPSSGESLSASSSLQQSSDSLNLTCSTLGSLDTLGNNFVVTFMLCRASGGRKERNRRAVFALGEKGLKTVETSVMNLVSILTMRRQFCSKISTLQVSVAYERTRP